MAYGSVGIIHAVIKNNYIFIRIEIGGWINILKGSITKTDIVFLDLVKHFVA